jgi:hypothetical protein
MVIGNGVNYLDQDGDNVSVSAQQHYFEAEPTINMVTTMYM